MNMSKLQLVKDLLVQPLQAHNRPQLSFILNFPNKLCYLENLLSKLNFYKLVSYLTD